MAGAIREISTITSKGQTTVPKSVRQALGIHHGDKIAFRIDERGVTVHRVDDDGDDPAITAFLKFLATNMETHPDVVTTFPPTLMARISELTKGIAVDLDAPIIGEVDF